MNKKSILKRLLQTLLPLLFGCLILWLLYRNIDFEQLWYTIRNGVNYWILGLSLLFGLGANIMRGLRWHLLVRSTDEDVSRPLSVLAVLGNYAVNMAFPRMGEVWRCVVVTNYAGVGFSKLLGTLLIDRVMDFVVVGLLVAFVSIFNLDFFIRFFSENPALLDTLSRLIASPWLYIILAALIFGGVFLFRRFSHLALIQKIRDFATNLFRGLQSIARLRHKGLFVLYTVLLWGGYFLFFYVTFFAFSFTGHLSLMQGLIAFVMGSIAVAAPVQAGMGAWHFMVIYSLLAFGVGREDASSFALIVHTTQTLWTTLCGVVAIGLLGFIPKSQREQIGRG